MFAQPYLFFDGRCEEALAFYRKAIGAEVTMLMRNNESPDPHPPGMLPPGSENKILHCSFTVGETTILASDGHCAGKPNFQGFSLTITVDDDAEADRTYAALADGGNAMMPPVKTFFSSRFGMLTDRFGVGWMVIVKPAA